MITEEELKYILGEIKNIKKSDPNILKDCMKYLKTVKES